MLKMRKIATASVLGLLMCLALLSTGAFAQSANTAVAHTACGGCESGVGGGFLDGFNGEFGGFGGLNGGPIAFSPILSCGCIGSGFGDLNGGFGSGFGGGLGVDGFNGRFGGFGGLNGGPIAFSPVVL